MYSGLQTRRTAHQLYLKMSYLELEKVRRRKEMEAISKRMDALVARAHEVEMEIAATQAEIADHPDAVPQQDVDRARQALGSGAGPASREHGSGSRVPGLSIRY